MHLLSRSAIILLFLSANKVVPQIGFAFVSQNVIEELLVVIDETIDFVDRLENLVGELAQITFFAGACGVQVLARIVRKVV